MDINSFFKQEIDKVAPDIWLPPLALKRGDFLVRKGNQSPFLYYVEEGALRIFVEGEEEELTIRFGYQGSFISALNSFLADQASAFHIQALKKSTVWPIAKAQFFQFIDQQPTYQKLWQKAIEHLVLQQLEREIDILTPSPQLRYQRVLQRSPQLFQEIPNKYIASYLRMTPETLSRLKKS